MGAAPPGGFGGASERAQGGRMNRSAPRAYYPPSGGPNQLREDFSVPGRRKFAKNPPGARMDSTAPPVGAGFLSYHGTVEAAFFDLDKTIISKSSSLALTRPMYRAGLVTRSTLLKGAYAQLVYLMVGADEKRMDKVKDSMAALTRGWDKQQVEEIVREALATLIDPYIYLEALDLMELHRALGRTVFIVSSSPEEVVRPLSEHLGPVEVIATIAEVVDGKYTGEVGFYCYAQNKADRIREVAARQGIDL